MLGSRNTPLNSKLWHSGFTRHISQSQVSDIRECHSIAHTQNFQQHAVIVQECKSNWKEEFWEQRGKQANKAVNCKSGVCFDHWMMDAGFTVCVYWGIECCLWAQALPWEQTDHPGVVWRRPRALRHHRVEFSALICFISSLMFASVCVSVDVCVGEKETGSIHLTGACVPVD